MELTEYDKSLYLGLTKQKILEAMRDLWWPQYQFVPIPEDTTKLLEYKPIPEGRLREWPGEITQNGEYEMAWIGTRHDDPSSHLGDHRIVWMDFTEVKEQGRLMWINLDAIPSELDEVTSMEMADRLGYSMYIRGNAAIYVQHRARPYRNE